jgi:hypothetical protein
MTTAEAEADLKIDLTEEDQKETAHLAKEPTKNTQEEKEAIAEAEVDQKNPIKTNAANCS